MIESLMALVETPSFSPASESLRDVANQLLDELRRVLDECAPPFSVGLSNEERDHILTNAQNQALTDLRGLLSKDPAALRSPAYVLGSYTSFRAVFLHRLAHQLLLESLKETSAQDLADALSNPAQSLPPADPDNFLTLAARQISERAKIQTRVDIHPAARIGCPFVLDHGAGTVIGETVCIGRDCYFLQDVVLGSTNIRDNPPQDRHPKIGDDVIIAGGVRAFGSIKIGSGARIQGLAILTHDIPPNTHVQVQTFLQIVDPKYRLPDATMPVLHAVLPGVDGLLTLFGNNLQDANVALVNQNLEILSPVTEHLHIILQSPNEIRIRIQSPFEIMNAAPSTATGLKPASAAPSNATNRVWGVCVTEKTDDRPGRVFLTIPGLNRHLVR